MKLLKRSVSLLIALVTVLTLAACGGKEQGKGSDTGGSNVDVQEYELDFSDRNYEGYEFRVLRVDAERQHGLTGHPNDIYIEEGGSNTLAYAVWSRNQLLSQLLNISISMKMDHLGSQLAPFLQKAVMGGDTYDMVIQEMEFFPSLINMGLLKDMNDLNMDTSYSWWDSAAESAFGLSGKQYGMVSDIIYLDKLSTVGMFYNTIMAAKLELPDLFAMVDEGEWTYAKMLEFAELASTSGEEIYGLSSQNDASYYFLHAANIKTVIQNTDGTFKFNIATNRAVTLLQDVFTMMNQDYFFNRQTNNLTVDAVAKTFESQTMFLARPLQTFYYLSNYCDNYGVLPMPKYDELSGSYYSAVNHHVATFISVPSDNKENVRTADVLQAWGMLSKKIVMPELYDRILSSRMVKDPNSARMVDIILRNRVYDVGFIWNFGSIESTLVLSTDIAINRAPVTIGSTVAALKTRVDEDLNEHDLNIQK